MYKLLKQVIYIVILSVILGFTRYFFLDDYKLFDNSKENTSSKQSIKSDLEEYITNVNAPELVDLSTARLIYDKKLAVFIDAREKIDFNDGHILHSINIPYGLDDGYNSSLLDSLFYLDKPIVIYCSGEGCSLSEDLSYDLYENHNFYSILYFEEGYPVWEESGYPVQYPTEKNDDDIPSNKAFLNFIDYIVILSIILILGLYLSNTYNHFIPIIARLILGFIFIYFSLDKILDPQLFSDLIKNYDIVPGNFIRIGALIVPWLELIIGILLILGIFIDSATSLSIGLLTLFVIMIGQAFLRGKSIDCGCSLSDLSDTSSLHKRIYMIKRIVQDICFIGYALIVKYKSIFKGKND